MSAESVSQAFVVRVESDSRNGEWQITVQRGGGMGAYDQEPRVEDLPKDVTQGLLYWLRALQ